MISPYHIYGSHEAVIGKAVTRLLRARSDACSNMYRNVGYINYFCFCARLDYTYSSADL